MIAGISHVGRRAPVFRSDGQGDEADDLGREGLRIWRWMIDKQFHNACQQSQQQMGHVFICLEMAADMIFN